MHPKIVLISLWLHHSYFLSLGKPKPWGMLKVRMARDGALGTRAGHHPHPWDGLFSPNNTIAIPSAPCHDGAQCVLSQRPPGWAGPACSPGGAVLWVPTRAGLAELWAFSLGAQESWVGVSNRFCSFLF